PPRRPPTRSSASAPRARPRSRSCFPRAARRRGGAGEGHALVLDDLEEAPVEGPLADALVRCGVALGVLDDGAGHVDAAGPLDAFEPGGAVDLQDLGPALALEHVDAGDLEPHRLGRADGHAAVAPGQGDAVALAPAVEVGPELTRLGHAPHGG